MKRSIFALGLLVAIVISFGVSHADTAVGNGSGSATVPCPTPSTNITITGTTMPNCAFSSSGGGGGGASLMSVIQALPGIQDCYPMNETSGTTIVDNCGSVNGTYEGDGVDGFSLGFPMGIADGSKGADFWGGSGGYAYITGLPMSGSTGTWTIGGVVRVCDSLAQPTGNGAWLFGTLGADVTNDKNGIGVRLADANNLEGLYYQYGTGSVVAGDPLIWQFGINCSPILIIMEYDGTSTPGNRCKGVPCFTVWVNGLPLETVNATITASNAITTCVSTLGTGGLTDICSADAFSDIFVTNTYMSLSDIVNLQSAMGR